VTLDQMYGHAMEITDQAEADAWFERCVEYSMRDGRARAEAEAIERRNLGYYAGYYSNETRARVEKLFRCAHPIFGAIADKGPPENPFRMGLEMGQAAKRKRDEQDV
jgi:hypothetical protein